MKYSQTTKCFYPDDLGYTNLPPDIEDVAIEEFNKALTTKSSQVFEIIEGKCVISDKNTTLTVSQQQTTIAKQRKKRYIQESDSLFFEYQRGEIDKQIWLDAIEKIKQELPFPVNS